MNAETEQKWNELVTKWESGTATAASMKLSRIVTPKPLRLPSLEKNPNAKR